MRRDQPGCLGRHGYTRGGYCWLPFQKEALKDRRGHITGVNARSDIESQ